MHWEAKLDSLVDTLLKHLRVGTETTSARRISILVLRKIIVVNVALALTEGVGFESATKTSADIRLP